MARRNQARSTRGLYIVGRVIPWKTLVLVLLLGLIGIPAFLYGSRLGGNIIPSTTQFFSNMFAKAQAPSTTPTPRPAFASALPQIGSLLYTVQEGDSCVEMLSSQMHMYDAGEVFSDVVPNTVRALNSAIGQDCHKLQPGMMVKLSPHYPLVALSGEVLKINATTPQQVVPTPLIHVSEKDYTVDCSDGCLFTVRTTPGTQIQLEVSTTLPVRVGSWIWTQAMFPRKNVPGFSAYPYVDPQATLNGLRLKACDFEADGVHDQAGLLCRNLTPNTIKGDGGSWLFGVTGTAALDHWRYPLRAAKGTRVLLWLSEQNGRLSYQKGNDAYRYDEARGIYVKL